MLEKRTKKGLENKYKYVKEYQKNNVKVVTITLNKKLDYDIIEKLSDIDKKATYIKNLIREDIKKEGK